jgi:DNA-3-methyladenine glycosylase
MCSEKLLPTMALRSLPNAPSAPENELSGVRCLARRALPIDTEALARYLVGKTLVHETPEGPVGGRIVETEAYVIGDAACHAFRGETPRNRSLFLERGHAYVYFIYGCWFALNVAGSKAGIGTGVLLRALEPVFGVELMRQRRPESSLRDLARGPGRLATALGIDRRYDGIDLCVKGPLWLGTPIRPVSPVGVSTRIGITQEADRLLRFYERGNTYVSGPKNLNR